MIVYIILGLLLVIYLAPTYISLRISNNLVKNTFSVMDISFKNRWDLIPNLVEIVKGYAKHEEEAFERITYLRTDTYENMSMDKKIDVNEQLSQWIPKIMEISENYPDLKANQDFMKLSKYLTKIEYEIAKCRKYYNETVRDFNNKIQMFPLAGLFGFHSATMFEANEEEMVM